MHIQNQVQSVQMSLSGTEAPYSRSARNAAIPLASNFHQTQNALPLFLGANVAVHSESHHLLLAGSPG